VRRGGASPDGTTIATPDESRNPSKSIRSYGRGRRGNPRLLLSTQADEASGRSEAIMSSWSFLHIGAELVRGRTIDVPASERELASNHVLPTLWLSLFDPEELEVFDVTDEMGMADLVESGLVA